MIPGHIGFTLGLATLLHNRHHRPALTPRQLFLIALVSLFPDVLDRSLHWLFAFYPDHLIFHSLPLYTMALLVSWRLRPRLLGFAGIMALHTVLDLANTDPRHLLWPLFGWRGWEGVETSHVVIAPMMKKLPPLLSVTDSPGHYLLFEVAGTILIVWAIWVAVTQRKNNSTNTYA